MTISAFFEMQEARVRKQPAPAERAIERRRFETAKAEKPNRYIPEDTRYHFNSPGSHPVELGYRRLKLLYV